MGWVLQNKADKTELLTVGRIHQGVVGTLADWRANDPSAGGQWLAILYENAGPDSRIFL